MFNLRNIFVKASVTVREQIKNLARKLDHVGNQQFLQREKTWSFADNLVKNSDKIMALDNEQYIRGIQREYLDFLDDDVSNNICGLLLNFVNIHRRPSHMATKQIFAWKTCKNLLSFVEHISSLKLKFHEFGHYKSIIAVFELFSIITY